MSEQERNEMAKRNINLIYHVLGQLNLLDMQDEFIDIGYLGLSRGIDNFKKEKGYKESTYLTACIKREIINHIRSELRLKRHKYSTVSLNALINDTNCDTFVEYLETLADDSVNFEKEIETKDLFEIAENNIEKLKDSHKKIIKYSYGVGGYPKLTLTELSNMMGISKQAVFVQKKKALANLKKMMKEDGVDGN